MDQDPDLDDVLSDTSVLSDVSYVLPFKLIEYNPNKSTYQSIGECSLSYESERTKIIASYDRQIYLRDTKLKMLNKKLKMLSNKLVKMEKKEQKLKQREEQRNRRLVESTYRTPSPQSARPNLNGRVNVDLSYRNMNDLETMSLNGTTPTHTNRLSRRNRRTSNISITRSVDGRRMSTHSTHSLNPKVRHRPQDSFKLAKEEWNNFYKSLNQWQENPHKPLNHQPQSRRKNNNLTTTKNRTRGRSNTYNNRSTKKETESSKTYWSSILTNPTHEIEEVVPDKNVITSSYGTTKKTTQKKRKSRIVMNPTHIFKNQINNELKDRTKRNSMSMNNTNDDLDKTKSNILHLQMHDFSSKQTLKKNKQTITIKTIDNPNVRIKLDVLPIDTILNIKLFLRYKYGVDINDQPLYFRGKFLPNESRIKDHNLTSKNVLRLMCQIFGLKNNFNGNHERRNSNINKV